MKKLIAVVLLGVTLLGLACSPKKEQATNARDNTNKTEQQDKNDMDDLFKE